ncbi:MAG: Mannuronate-specific alginate lyase [Bacteroidota bacterium]|jgi:hypothetical protein
MKNLLYTLLAVLALVSCSKEDEVVTPPAPNKYTLTITADTGGAVSSPGGTYTEGSKITVTATPDGMYLFKEWSDGSTQNPREITVTSNLTLKASFLKKTYPLAVTVEGEGTVAEEVIIQGSTTETEYNAGTTVRLTATPNEGWVFAGWSGDVESEELVIEVKVEKGTAVIASFRNQTYSYTENKITIEYPPSVDVSKVYNGWSYIGVAGTFHFSTSSGDFMFISGAVNAYEEANPNSALDVTPAPAVTLKLSSDSKWELYELDQDVLSWNIRAYEIKDNFVVIADGNEIGPGENWKGHLYFGEISDFGINWSRVTNDVSNMHYFHGVSLGDVNQDGYIDIATSPDNRFFINNGGNSFEKVTNNFREATVYNRFPDQFNDPTENSPFYCDSPFTLQLDDLDGDGVNEIITSQYGGVASFRDNNWRNICGYRYRLEILGKDENGKYSVAWRRYGTDSVFPENYGLGATSIKVFDVDNDGVKDLTITREDGGLTIEVWKGQGDNTFIPYYFYDPNNGNNPAFREYEVMDVNLDGYKDIVLRVNGFSPSNGQTWSSSYYIDPNDRKKGIKLNSTILINDGSGRFNPYNLKPLEIPNVYPERIQPYMKDGKLHFFGTYIGHEYDEFREYHSNYNTNELYPVLYDIELNLD